MNKKGLIALLVFNLAYILVFTILYLIKQDYEFLSYIAVLIIAGIFVYATLKYTKFDYLALWGLSLWGFLHLCGGGIRFNGHTLYATRIIEIFSNPVSPHFYILKMDQVIHFYGFLIAAIVVYQLLSPSIKSGSLSKGRAFLIAWIGSMGLGALNEVVEFMAMLSLAQTGVGDLYNTGFDLIFNLLGALTGTAIQSLRQKKK